MGGTLSLDAWCRRYAPERLGGLALLWPTYVARASADDHHARFQQLLVQVDAMGRMLPEIPITVFAGMQWSPGEQADAVRRLRRLVDLAAARRVRTVGLAVAGQGKVVTINAALTAGAPLALAGWAWVDDDVTLTENCLAVLARRFVERGCRGSVGAEMTWLPEEGRLTRTFARVKSLVPKNPHPAAACMLVETAVVAAGIPARHFCDDGYVLFRLLDPARPDPYENMEVLSEARCVLVPPRGLREVVRQRRRYVLGHLVSMASASPAAALVFFRSGLFYGLWPLAPWDDRNGGRTALCTWALRSVNFIWFCAEAAVIATRAALGRPLRQVKW